jgi:hypothetical protein
MESALALNARPSAFLYAAVSPRFRERGIAVAHSRQGRRATLHGLRSHLIRRARGRLPERLQRARPSVSPQCRLRVMQAQIIEASWAAFKILAVGREQYSLGVSSTDSERGLWRAAPWSVCFCSSAYSSCEYRLVWEERHVCGYEKLFRQKREQAL